MLFARFRFLLDDGLAVIVCSPCWYADVQDIAFPAPEPAVVLRFGAIRRFVTVGRLGWIIHFGALLLFGLVLVRGLGQDAGDEVDDGSEGADDQVTDGVSEVAGFARAFCEVADDREYREPADESSHVRGSFVRGDRWAYRQAQPPVTGVRKRPFPHETLADSVLPLWSAGGLALAGAQRVGLRPFDRLKESSPFCTHDQMWQKGARLSGLSACGALP